MSYATLLLDEQVKQNYLVVMTPRRKLTGWTLHSGFVYKSLWSYSKPRQVDVNGVEMTEAGSTSLSAGQFYYDESTTYLYLRTPDSANPTSKTVVVYYELYAARIDAYWYRIPTDSSTTVVYFEPTVSKSPENKNTVTDALHGYIPVVSGNIKLNNSEHIYEDHISESSFSGAQIKIYHALGETLSTSNTKLIYDGLMTSIDYSGDSITIKTVDRVDIFNQEWRNEDKSFFSTSDFPNVDPNYIGKCIRYVYGYVKGFRPVNIDYKSENPTTSDNRDWVVCGNQTGLSEISRTVGSSSTTTRTYISFAEGIQVGDTVWLDRVSGTDEYKIVTAVSLTPAYIEHSALSGVAMASGDSVKKGFVSRVDIFQDNVKYTALYGRDYTCGNFNATTRGFSFTTSLESNLSMAQTLRASDIVSCTVYGRVNDLTAGGPTFGANDPISNNLTNPTMILYDILKNKIGISESEIDLTAFASVRTSTASEGLGFSIPHDSTGGFTTYKTIITEILKSGLLRLVIDNDNKWSVSQLAPFSTADKSLNEEELFGGFDYEFDYSDLVSDVLIEYQRMQIPDTAGQNGPSYSRETASSDTARYLHLIEKQMSYDSLHFKQSDAQTLAERISYVFGDRKGRIKFETNLRFLDSLLNDTVTISRDRMPGFSFVRSTRRDKSGSIVELSKGTKKVTIVIDDQKGIQDNSGSW